MKKGLIFLLGFITATLIALVVVFATLHNMKSKNNEESNLENNTISANEIEKENTSDEDDNSKQKDKKNRDSSFDVKKEVIMLEGQEEEVTTIKYISSLGYSIRYYSDYHISKDENTDIYLPNEEDKDIVCYYTIEKGKTTYEQAIAGIQNYTKTTINNYQAIYYTEKKDNSYLKHYYINVSNEVFIISLCYPASDYTAFEEGFVSRVGNLLDTFTIE